MSKSIKIASFTGKKWLNCNDMKEMGGGQINNEWSGRAQTMSLVTSLEKEGSLLRL